MLDDEKELPPPGHPLNALATRLGELLDEDHWAECEALLLKACAARAKERAPHWRDVAEELPQEAQEVLFVRGGKTVHGAWIGGIFWHSNQKMAAAKWMPLPLPPNAYLHGQADRNQQLTAKDQRIAELEALCAENNGIIQRMGIGIKDKDRLIAQLVRDAEMYGPNKLAIEKQAWVMADSVREIRELRDQLAAQALTIKTMREALEKFIDSHEECTDFDGFTAQVVSMDDYHKAQEAISIPDNSTEVLDKYTKPLNNQLAAQALTIKTMREALNIWINIAANCSIESGCCCCGESMKNHSHPMSCGHSPVDMADSIAYEAIAETDKALAIPDNSTEILQEWLDKQLGEPVAVVSHNCLSSQLCDTSAPTW